MALNPVWANELWIGTEYSSSSWSYAKLCKGIESMQFQPNEQNQQYFFICGEGFAHNEVTGAGLCCEVGPSTPSEVYLSKDAYIPVDLTINGKHHNLMTLSDTMNGIHSALTRAKTYPSADHWEIVDIATATLPQVLGREDNNDWLMASSLSVRIYQKGD